MQFVKTLHQVRKNDARQAGGKGASLGEMLNAGLPVPDGFVITSSAFERFLKETGIGSRIKKRLSMLDHEDATSMNEASKEIMSSIIKGTIPYAMKEEILFSFKALGVKYTAVRSSATAEDSASSSWAGQLDTYLNTNEQNLLGNIKKCWASLFTPRAIFYRFEKKLHRQRISVAVVVQKMVESEVSGIAFSVNPVLQGKNRLVIEAGYGLGEAIVSGQITPDNYAVERKPLKIVERKTSKQTRGLYRKPEGGDEWKQIKDGDKQKLNDSQIFKLSSMILKIERHYGFPVDVEWAMEKGAFYVTQSRPITTIRENIKVKRAKPKWDALGESLKAQMWKWRWYGNCPPLDNVWQRDTRWSDQLNKIGGFRVKYYLDFFDGPILTMYDSERDKEEIWNLIKRKFRADSNYISASVDGFDELVKPDVKMMELVAAKSRKAKNLSTFGMIKLFRNSRDYFSYNSAMDSYCAYAEPALSPILNLYLSKKLKELGKSSETNQYMTKLTTPLKPTEFSFEREAFFEILDRLKSEKISAAVIEDRVLFERFITGKPQLKRLLTKHIRQYDWLLMANSAPMLFEQLREELRNYLSRKESDYSIERRSLDKLLAGKPEQEAKKIIAELKPPCDIQDMIKGLQEVAYVRTKTGVLNNKLTYTMIPFYSRIAKRLGTNYLSLKLLFPEEIISLLRKKLSAEKLLKERASGLSYIVFKDKRHVFIGEEAQSLREALIKEIEEKELETGLLIGTSANPGIVKGSARVLKDTTQIERIQKGEILVARATSIDFVPAMRKASAIITETGGMTSHAAIVSRELGVPCVVGVENATKVLKDGDWIKVDADKGKVSVLKRK